jgi:AraC family transcriptional regulator
MSVLTPEAHHLSSSEHVISNSERHANADVSDLKAGGELPIWKPQRDTCINIPELCFMHGGPAGMHLPEHEHNEVQLEVHFLSQGAGVHRVLPESPAFLKLIPSRKPHVGRWRDGDEVIVVLLGHEYIARAKDEVSRRSSPTIVGTDCAVDPVILALGTTLRREFRAGGIRDKAYLEALGIVLSGHLVRQWSACQSERKEAGRLAPALLRRTIEALEERRNISVALLAEEIGLGPHQFTRLFRRTTGYSPYQFLVQRRLARASALLESTQLPLAQIALEAGFANQSHFTSAFRKHFRSTPLRFRQERRRR